MIAVCPNPFRDIDLALSRKAASLLEEAGYESVICPVFADRETDAVPKNVPVSCLQDVIDAVSLAIVIGGDGTILEVSHYVHGHDIPILGLNLGTMGFMANLEPEDLPLILRAAKGDYRLSGRMLLDVSLQHGGEELYHGLALNDAVIHGYGDTIYLNVDCNSQPMTTFGGDGIILATPTGSTGYSMSAGGPIVEPEAENIIVSPICAHTIASRSFVLGPERIVSVTAKKMHDRRAYLSVDGSTVTDVNKDDVLVVKKSSHKLLMADLGVRSFYETTFEKLT